VNARKDVFYCHAAGGAATDPLRPVIERLILPPDLASLDPRALSKADSSAVIEEAATFYQQQLDRCPRRSTISTGAECMIRLLSPESGIGYAPGWNDLASISAAQGHSFDALRG